MITVLEQGQVGSDTKHPSRSLTHLFWLNLGTFSSRKCFGLNYVTLFNILNYILQFGYKFWPKRKEKKKKKQSWMFWAKLIFSGWVLIICIQWNMEQWSKTKIIYAQRPCHWKESQYQFKTIPVLLVSGTSRFLLLIDFCTKNSVLKGQLQKKPAAPAGSGRTEALLDNVLELVWSHRCKEARKQSLEWEQHICFN